MTHEIYGSNEFRDSQWYTKEAQRELSNCLSKEKYSHFVTLTYGDVNRRLYPDLIIKDVAHLHRLIRQKAFGNNALSKKKENHMDCIVVLERNKDRDGYHVHMLWMSTFDSPRAVFRGMKIEIKEAWCVRMKLTDSTQVDIQDVYSNPGVLDYMLKDGRCSDLHFIPAY